MRYPQTITDYTPTLRVDAPWTRARVDEAPDEHGAPGAFTPLATLDLETGPGVNPIGLDADPMEPATRTFTVPATRESGWLRVTWLDDDDGEGPTDPVPYGDVEAGLLATVDDVERYLHTQGTVARGAPINPDLIAGMLAAASDRMREARPERTLSPVPASAAAGPVERRFPARRNVQVPDLREATEVRIDEGDPLAATDYTLVRRRPEDPALWIRLKQHCPVWGDELVITGRWGPAQVRPSVREACIVWVARVYHMRTARFADNAPVAGGDGGVLGYFRNLPPDVKVVLDQLWIPGA